MKFVFLIYLEIVWFIDMIKKKRLRNFLCIFWFFIYNLYFNFWVLSRLFFLSFFIIWILKFRKRGSMLVLIMCVVIGFFFIKGLIFLGSN